MKQQVRTACSACGRSEDHWIEADEIVPDDWFCRSCMARYPSVILLATVAAPGSRFALGLRNGIEVHFFGAEVVPNGRFVRVHATKTFGSDPEYPEYTKISVDDGEIDISVDEIAWCCER